MQRAERAGLGLSVVGHVGLLAILSLNLMSVRELPKLSEPMDVMLVDKAGLISAAASDFRVARRCTSSASSTFL